MQHEWEFWTPSAGLDALARAVSERRQEVVIRIPLNDPVSLRAVLDVGYVLNRIDRNDRIELVAEIPVSLAETMTRYITAFY